MILLGILLTAVVPSDKLLHATTAASLQAVCEHVAKNPIQGTLARSLTCLAAVNGLGAIKELTDPMHGGERELYDAAANAAGSVGMSLILKIEF